MQVCPSPAALQASGITHLQSLFPAETWEGPRLQADIWESTLAASHLPHSLCPRDMYRGASADAQRGTSVTHVVRIALSSAKLDKQTGILSENMTWTNLLHADWLVISEIADVGVCGGWKGKEPTSQIKIDDLFRPGPVRRSRQGVLQDKSIRLNIRLKSSSFASNLRITAPLTFRGRRYPASYWKMSCLW